MKKRAQNGRGIERPTQKISVVFFLPVARIGVLCDPGLPEMTFKHWIAVDQARSLPIPNWLSKSHYGLLYFIN